MDILKKFTSSYLSNKAIVALDVFLSTFATVLCLVALRSLVGVEYLNRNQFFIYISIALLASFVAECLVHTYRYAIRHMTLTDVFILALMAFIKDGFLLVVLFACNAFTSVILFYLSFDFLLTIFMMLGCRVVMLKVYNHYKEYFNPINGRTNILIFGTRTKASSLVLRLANSSEYNVVGLISKDVNDSKKFVNDKRVYYFDTYKDFLNFASSNSIKAVLFAHESEAKDEVNGLLRVCYQNKMKVMISPSLNEVDDGKVMKGAIREIKIEDLLGREEISIDMTHIKSEFGGKTVMVTGAAGSIGSELVRQLVELNVKKIILFDNAETPLHNIRLELEDRFPDLDFEPVIGDVRSLNRLDYVFNRWHPQIVFHAAAYKHVPLMEENPCEAVLVNVVGSRNLADKCIEYGVESMIMISTDKAVNPTNVMGCTKRIAEMYVQSLGSTDIKTRFVTTRFGNVLGSNGSVIPRFKAQIEKGGPVAVTHPEITRFFMTIPEACHLVMAATVMPESNKIYVFDMGTPVKIDSLARKMIELSGLRPNVDIQIEYTGLRPGEKLYEEVLADSENTIPTTHDRIRIACVRELNYEEVKNDTFELESMARDCDADSLVQKMKVMVPEYKSKNSEFAKFDIPMGGGEVEDEDLIIEV